jgi:retron-type reverse transcriptase
VRSVLEEIFEVEFLGFSYGFRPGRSAHDALDALWMGLMERRINWVLDCDIRGFFDAMTDFTERTHSISTKGPT